MTFNAYAQEWLPNNRPDDWLSRAKRSVWEMKRAAQTTDIFLLNPIDTSGQTSPGAAAYQSLDVLIHTVLKSLPHH